jgi:predicted metalloprotease with PDZ domain
MYVGTRADKEEFRSSWVMCHEMTHLAFPSLPREQHWIEEGMATYIEPIARAMTGIVSEESMWEEIMRKAPDAFRNIRTGLNGETDYRRIYWGGAVFFLLADIEIRRNTKNKYTLQDAMQAILRSEGTMNVDRDVYRVLRTGDKAVTGRVLENLYEKFGKTAYIPDLERLWRELGVERNGSTVRFRNDAPLAAVRKAICAPTCKACIDGASKGK